MLRVFSRKHSGRFVYVSGLAALPRLALCPRPRLPLPSEGLAGAQLPLGLMPSRRWSQSRPSAAVPDPHPRLGGLCPGSLGPVLASPGAAGVCLSGPQRLVSEEAGLLLPAAAHSLHREEALPVGKSPGTHRPSSVLRGGLLDSSRSGRARPLAHGRESGSMCVRRTVPVPQRLLPWPVF